ncbi:hypothetical protein [Defluviimonas salinarum]|uniref:Uncharacterized protein n=1 Tax=Defluviimonas salinarum TaxID=2992147 RepID=A0ABT3J5R6_9RHOB|nr:hypothetical protein [Defluviimonas salinarum]MCW3783031.1 hypothetical protein [Defluviimonas salinarum]
MTNYTDEERRRGRRLMKELAPRIKAEVMKQRRETPADASRMAPRSGVGQGLMAELTERNLDALIVYRRGERQWYADVTLKGLPPGVANVLGTPVRAPLPTEAEAQAAGRSMLIGIWATILDNQSVARDTRARDRIFELHGYEIPIPAEIVEAISAAQRPFGQAIGLTPADSRAQLRLRLTEIMGADRFDPDIWEKASDHQRMLIQANIVSLLAMGDVRYPPHITLAPTEEDAGASCDSEAPQP